MRRVFPLGLRIIALTLILPGCNGPPPLIVPERASPAIALAASSATEPTQRAPANASASYSTDLFRKCIDVSRCGAQSVDQPNAADADWLMSAPQDPDPKVRLHALEVWAQRPSESLDPVTSALVDPDESVRARAQELLEQQLARH
jgi:hypothetical protein